MSQAARQASATTEPKPQLRVVKSRPAVALEFQPDAVEIEQQRPPAIARLTLYLVTGLIIAALAWAAVSKIDEVVVARGKLITSAPHIVIQPLETSVLRSIDVAFGDVVRKDQILAHLDPTFSQADVGQINGRIAEYDAMIDRLEAELAEKDYAPGADATTQQRLQHRLYEQRRASLRSSLANLDEQIARDSATLASAAAEQKLLEIRHETMVEIEGMRSTLLANKTGSKLSFLQSKDARIEVETALQRLDGKQLELKHAIDKGRAERQTVIEDFRRTSIEQLVETKGKRSAAAEELKKAELRRQLVVLRAPADGVVLDIARRSIGSVVREAETLFAIVPLNSPLEAEVQAEGKDVGYLEIGQPVRLKLDAFPFQKHGTATGSVRLISQDSFVNEQKAEVKTNDPMVYRMRVTLDDIGMRDLPEEFRMLPGMAVTAEVKVGMRTVLSYFLYPLLRGLDESIREP